MHMFMGTTTTTQHHSFPLAWSSLYTTSLTDGKPLLITSVKGLVLGNSFEYYRRWIIWMSTYRATRMLATVFHKHKYISNPSFTPEDAVIEAADKLTDTIQGHMPHQLIETVLDQLTRL